MLLRVKIKDMPSGVSYTVSLLLYSYSPSPRKAPLLLYLYSHILPSPRKASFIFTLLSLLFYLYS